MLVLSFTSDAFSDATPKGLVCPAGVEPATFCVPSKHQHLQLSLKFSVQYTQSLIICCSVYNPSMYIFPFIEGILRLCQVTV